MKKLYILSLFILSSFAVKAATAQFLFLNNNINATKLDLEVRVKGVDTVYLRVNNISYLKATTILTLPSSVLLKLTFFNSGTTSAFYTKDNAVFDDNKFMIGTLFGTSSSLRFTETTGYKVASTGTKFKYDFLNSTPTLQEIDLKARGGATMADNLAYGDITFSFGSELSASDIILDVTPSNASNVLFAFNLNASTLGGKYIYLFTAGTGTALTMYMLKMDGTVTQLSAAALSGLYSSSKVLKLAVYPNPVSDLLYIENSLTGEYHLELTNMQGQTVASANAHSDGQGSSLNVSELPEGLFLCTLKNENRVYTAKVNIKH